MIYSLIAAAVTYIMWSNVGKERIERLSLLAKRAIGDSGTLDKRKGHWKVSLILKKKCTFSSRIKQFLFNC